MRTAIAQQRCKSRWYSREHDEDKSIAKQCQKMKANEMKMKKKSEREGGGWRADRKSTSKCTWKNENLIRNIALSLRAHGAHTLIWMGAAKAKAKPIEMFCLRRFGSGISHAGLAIYSSTSTIRCQPAIWMKAIRTMSPPSNGSRTAHTAHKMR